MQRQYTAHSALICAARALESKPALARHAQLPPSLPGVFKWAWRAAEGFDTALLAGRIEAECAVYCRAKEPVEKEEKTSN